MGTFLTMRKLLNGELIKQLSSRSRLLGLGLVGRKALDKLLQFLYLLLGLFVLVVYHSLHKL